jgi:hypothetical protein
VVFLQVIENVSFTRPSNPYAKVFYAGPLTQASFQASSFYDKYGHMTGQANAAVIPDTPFDKMPSCYRSPHVREALVCPGVKSSALYFIGLCGDCTNFNPGTCYCRH